MPKKSMKVARNSSQFGVQLSRIRRQAGLTQQQLSDRAGVRQATISNIENGSDATRIGTLFKLLAALGFELQIAPRQKLDIEDIRDIF